MSVIVVHAAVFARIMTAAVIVVMGFIKIARSSLNASGNFFDLVVGQLARLARLLKILPRIVLGNINAVFFRECQKLLGGLC